MRRYIPGPGTDEPIVWYEGSGTTDKRWLHADERGSIVAITNSAGTAIALNRYDEYGIPLSTNQGRFGYTGQAFIPELGLWYYKARMYSATLGRFMQTDPIGYKDGINWYDYVDDDPVNRTDPDGQKGLAIIADFALEVAIQYAETGKVDVGKAVVETAKGALNPLKTVQKVATLGKIAAKALKTVCCFAPETEVLTESGSRTIASLEIGDRVWAEDRKSGKQGWRAITKLYVNDRKAIWELKLQSSTGVETHRVTDNHPYWVMSAGWIEVKDLKPGMSLVSNKGEIIRILSATNTGKIERTYNLEVDDLHSFFVGKTPVLVHNGCRKADFTRATKAAVRREQPNCEKCGTPTTSGKADAKGQKPADDRSEIHHKEAVKDGGTKDRSNAENLCRACHVKEHSK